MIVVDDARWAWQGRCWAHLCSTTDFAELHDFAEAIGKRRVGFQGDHYDVDETERERALAAGATQASSREIVRALRAAGLRRARLKPKLQRCLSERCQLGDVGGLLGGARCVDSRHADALSAAASAVLRQHFSHVRHHAAHVEVLTADRFAAAVITLDHVETVGLLAPLGARARPSGRALGITELRAPVANGVSWIELLCGQVT